MWGYLVIPRSSQVLDLLSNQIYGPASKYIQHLSQADWLYSAKSAKWWPSVKKVDPGKRKTLLDWLGGQPPNFYVWSTVRICYSNGTSNYSQPRGLSRIGTVTQGFIQLWSAQASSLSKALEGESLSFLHSLPVCSNVAGWNIHHSVRWFSQLDTSIHRGFPWDFPAGHLWLYRMVFSDTFPRYVFSTSWMKGTLLDPPKTSVGDEGSLRCFLNQSMDGLST